MTAKSITLADLDGRLFATVPEVAALLRWDPRAVRRGIAKGRIPAVDNGGTYRVPVAWLRAQAGAGDTEQTEPAAPLRPAVARAAWVTILDADGLHVEKSTVR